jgi:hypothetical protein
MKFMNILRYMTVFVLLSGCARNTPLASVKQDEPQSLSANLWALSVPVKVERGISQGGCFSSYLRPNSWEINAALSTVFMTRVDPFVPVASGVVVKLPDGSKAILTASHVVDGIIGGGHDGIFGIMDSSGRPIARVIETMRGQKGYVTDKYGRKLPMGDLSVLKIISFIADGQRLYEGIPGVNLASAQSSKLLEGDVSNPAGFEGGISGGPSFNSQGQLIGLAVRKDEVAVGNEEGDWRITTNIHAPRPIALIDPRRPIIVDSHARFAMRSLAIVEPISDKDVLKALGMQNLSIDNNDVVSESVEMMGIPAGLCVVYKARLGTELIQNSNNG